MLTVLSVVKAATAKPAPARAHTAAAIDRAFFIGGSPSRLTATDWNATAPQKLLFCCKDSVRKRGRAAASLLFSRFPGSLGLDRATACRCVAGARLSLSQQRSKRGPPRDTCPETCGADHGRRRPGLHRAQRHALDGFPGSPGPDVALEHDVLADERLRGGDRSRETTRSETLEPDHGTDLLRQLGTLRVLPA